MLTVNMISAVISAAGLNVQSAVILRYPDADPSPVIVHAAAGRSQHRQIRGADTVMAGHSG